MNAYFSRFVRLHRIPAIFDFGRSARRFSLWIALSVACLASHSAFAASQTWVGGSLSDGNWSDTANWAGGAAPGSVSVTTSTDVALFNAAITNGWGTTGTPIVIDSSTQDIGGITFDTNADNYFIGYTGSNSLLLTSGGTIQILSTLASTNAVETINAPLVIEGTAGTYTFSNNSANGAGAGAGTLNFGGGITGGAAGATVLTLNGANTNSNTISGIIANGSANTLAITKSGASTWVLAGANIYTGTTTLNAGTLLGTQTSGTPFGTGAITLNGGTLSLAPTGSGSDLSLTGGTLAAGTLFTINGPDTLALNKGSQNSLTYTYGGTGAALARTNKGTLVITESAAGTLGSATGERFKINGTAPANVSTNANLINLPIVVQTSPTDSTADFLSYGATTGFASTAANYTTFSGVAATTVTGAIWNINGAASVTGTVTNKLGAIRVGAFTLTIGTGATGITLSLGTTATGDLAPIILNGGTIAPATGNSTIQSLTLGAGLEAPIYTSAAGGTISVNIIGTGSSLTLFGPGALTLSGGASTFTGGVTLNSGTVNINKVTALGTTAGTFVINGGTIDNTSGALITTGAEPMTINADFTFNGGTGTTHDLNFGAGATTLGTTAGTTRTITANAGTLTLGGVIGNGTTANTLIKAGNGALALSGASTFTGGVILNAGTLDINAAGVAGTSGPLGNGGTLTINGGTIDNTSTAAKVLLNVSPITIGGSFAFSTSAGTSTANNLTLPGNISIGGDQTITLNGAGALTLSGTLTNTADSVRTLTVSNGTGTASTSILTIGAYALTGPGSTAARNDIINGTGNVTISGTVTDGVSAASGLTYAGTGILTLSGANTYSGGLIIKSGTVLANVSNATTVSGAAGPSTNAINLGDASQNVAASLLANSFTVSNPIILASTTGGTLSIGPNGGSTAPTFSGGVSGANSFTVNNNSSGNTAFSNTLSNGGNVTVTGAGSGTVSLSVANSFTGNLIVKEGTVSLAVGSASSSAILLGDTSVTGAVTLNVAGVGGTLTNAITLTAAATNTSFLISSINTTTTGGGSNLGGQINLNGDTLTISASGGGGGQGNMTVSGGVIGTQSNSNLIFNQQGTNGFTVSGGTVNNNGTITNISTGGGTLTLSAPIGASVTQINQNASILSLSGLNTAFDGAVNLNAGTLKLGSTTALGGNGSTNGTGGALSIAAGTTLDSGVASLALTTINAENWNGPFNFGSSNALNTGTGAITVAAGGVEVINKGVNLLTVPGAVTGGNLSLVTTGAGGFTFSGAGGSINNSGSITNTALSSANTTLSGNLGASVVSVVQDNVPGSAGSGVLILSGNNTSFAGSIVPTSGVIQINGATSFPGGAPAAASVTVGGLGVLSAGYAINQAFINAVTPGSTGAVALALASANNLDFSSGGANLANVSLGASVNSTYSGTLTPNGTTYRLGGGGAALTVSTATLTGANSLVVGGPLNGTVILSGTNTYTGTTTLNSGTLNAGVAENAGTSGPLGNPTTPAGSIIFAGGTLQFSTSNTFDYSSRFATTASQPISIDTNSQTVTFASALTSSGGTLAKLGAGTLILSNAGNTYSGGTTITAGTLQVTAPGDLGSGGTVTLNGGTLQIGGTSTAFGTETDTFSLAASGAIDTNAAGNSATFGGNLAGAGSATATLTLQGSGTGTYSGAISDGILAGGVALTKSGTGIWILSSANTFSGATAISAGILQLNNSLALQNSIVTPAVTNGLTYNAGLGSATVQALSGPSPQVLQDTSSGAVTLNIGTYRNANSPNAYTAILSGPGGVTKFGTNTEAFSAANTYSGGTTLNGSGTLLGNGASATATTPFGTGAITLNGGTLSLAPATAATAANWTGASVASNTLFTYGPGGKVLLTRKDATSPLSFTVGGGGTVLNRSGAGSTLIIQTTNADLGVLAATGVNATENFIINGTAPTITASSLGAAANGIVNPSIVSLGATASVGDFLTYGANGFVITSGYTGHAANFAPTTNEIANITAAAATTAAGNPLAVRVGAFTLTIGTAISENLTVGSNSGQAGVILNGGTIAAFAGDSLAFGGAEGIVYSFNAASTISAPITGSGGLTIAGNNKLTLSSASNSFTGAINVDGGATLLINSAANLGNAANIVTLNSGAGLAAATTGGLLTGINAVTLNGGGNIGGSGTYDVNFAGTGGIVMNGGNILMAGNNSYNGATVVNTGRLMISSDANLGGSTTPLILSFNGAPVLTILGDSMTSFGSHPLILAGSGYGAFNPGTFDIQSPTNTFTLNQVDNASLNGSGTTFTKTGQGTLVATVPQTFVNATSNIGLALYGGTFEINAAAGASIVSTSGWGFDLQGGTLLLLGKSNASFNQTLPQVQNLRAGGASFIVDNNNSTGSTTTTLALGALANTYFAGGTLNIATQNLGAGSAVVTTTTLNDASGIIGIGRMTYSPSGGSAGFAYVTTNQIGGAIGAYTPGSNLPASGSIAGTNYLLTDSGAGVTSSETVNTLTIKTTQNGQSLAITAGQTLKIATGGLLFNGANNYSITSGTISSNTATNSDLIVQQYGTGTLTIGSVIANGIGASTLTKAGPGTLILSSANTYTGGTFINGGVLSVDVVGELGATATAALSLSAGTLQATNSITTTHTITLLGSGGTLDVSDGKTLTLNGIISGAGLTINDSGGAASGIAVLGAANTFSDGVWIKSGVLQLNNASALGATAAGTATNGLNTLTFGSAATEKLELNGFAAYLASLTDTSGHAVIENATSVTPVTLTVINGGNNTFAGTIQNGTGGGAVSLYKGGGLTLTLTGANSYTGSTTISNGTLQLGDGTSGHDGSIAGASIVDNAALAYDTNSTQNYAGVISGNGTVAKFGGGTLTLAGNNIYTGATTVTAGALIVSGSLSGGSAVTVGDPANLGTAAILAGNGLVGNVTVGAASGNTGAEASPSDNVTEANGAGTTLSTGNFTIGAASGATLALQIGRTSPGSILAGDGSDHISSSGTASLTGNLQLTIETGYTPAVNDVLYLIINDTSETGQFASVNGASLGGGNTFTFDNFTWQISYNATPTAFSGAGSDVAIEAIAAVAVPEPGTWAMMISGVGMLVGFQRFRRRRN